MKYLIVMTSKIQKDTVYDLLEEAPYTVTAMNRCFGGNGEINYYFLWLN